MFFVLNDKILLKFQLAGWAVSIMNRKNDFETESLW